MVDDGLRVDRVVLSRGAGRYPPELPGGYAERLDDDEEVYSALVVGLRAYVAKNGFRSVLIRTVRGIDSALVAAIAYDAVGAGERARRLDAVHVLPPGTPGTTRRSWRGAPG